MSIDPIGDILSKLGVQEGFEVMKSKFSTDDKNRLIAINLNEMSLRGNLSWKDFLFFKIITFKTNRLTFWFNWKFNFARKT